MTKKELIIQNILDCVYFEESNDKYLHFTKEQFEEMQHFLTTLTTSTNERELEKP